MNATVSSGTALASRSLADIAATLPGATAVFRRNRLDFCCGGCISLAEASAAKGLSPAEMERELAALAAASSAPLEPQTTEALINLIETRYHAVHRQELPELIRLARRVEAVHRDHRAVPAGLTGLLETVAGELEDHMRKEEQILFPLMRRGGHPMIAQPIAAMLAEHDSHGAHLRALEALTNDFVAPSDACATWRALYLGGRKLTDDLMEHIHLENNVLFPRFIG
jgi:regulator of cell morphogenesis and NO signaling